MMARIILILQNLLIKDTMVNNVKVHSCLGCTFLFLKTNYFKNMNKLDGEEV